MTNYNNSPPPFTADNFDEWYDLHIILWLEQQRTLGETDPDAQPAP